MVSSGYPRSAVVALALFVFVAFGVELYAMSVLLTENAAGGEFSIALLSAAFGGAGVVAGVIAPRIGRWVDQHSVRGLMSLGAVFAFAGMAVTSVATAEWMILAAFWLLIGPAQAMTLYEPAFVAISLWVDPLQRNKAISQLVLIGGLAGPVFLPVTGFAVQTFGWRPTAAGLGLAVMVTGLVAATFFYPKVTPTRDLGVVVPRVRWVRFWTDKRLGYISISVILIFAAMNTMLFHTVAVFEEQGFNVAFVALLAGLAGLLTFPGRYLAPRISDYIKPTTVFNWALLGIIGAMILAIIGSPMIVMVAHFVFFGLFFGFSIPLRAVIMNDWYAGPDFGSVMGKQWGVAGVVAGFAPFIVGAVRDQLGSYTIPLIGLTITVAVSAIFNELAARRDVRERARASN